MNEAPAGTSAESAYRIMGRACITLDEVLRTFPEARDWVEPKDYANVPFSAKVLYHLGGNPSPYVLLPAIPFRTESKFVNLYELEKFVQERFPAIKVDTRALYRIAVYALNNGLCPQKWYLLSSQVLQKKELAGNKALGNLPFRIERSIVYLYAWALFRRLRGRSIFSGRHFVCNDFFSTKRQTNNLLFLSHPNITVQELNSETKELAGKVPSLLPPEVK